MMFENRADAGQRLAEQLKAYKGKSNVIVLGLPRGGVVVAAEVAQDLQAPLDVVVVRKIGTLSNPETAVGAVMQDGTVIWNKEFAKIVDVQSQEMQQIVEQERNELARRLVQYRHGRGSLKLQNKIVILVDDGLATGLTMVAAIKSVLEQKPAKIIVAIPVSSAIQAAQIRGMQDVDDCLCLIEDPAFRAVGQYYNNFAQVSDEEVETLLHIVK
jgi:putative phosphoribosyl transferase